jgi:cell wall assembly regulator SMI1
VAEDWSRIERWLRQRAPRTAACIRAGASSADIERSENQFPNAWPSELRELYRLADGAPTGQLWSGVLPGWDFMPLASVEETSDMYSGFDWVDEELGDQPAGEPAFAFLPVFVPIGEDYTGCTLFVDCRAGQLFGCVTGYMREDADSDGPTWTSVSAMLQDVANALEHDGVSNGYRPKVEDGLLTWALEGIEIEPPRAAFPANDSSAIGAPPPAGSIDPSVAVVPWAGEDPSHDEQARVAGARIRADLAAAPAARALSGRFGTAQLSALLPRTASSIWDLIASLRITLMGGGGEPVVGGQFGMGTYDEEQDGFVGDAGEIVCRWTALERPTKVVMDWTWMEIVQPRADRVPRLPYHATLTATLEEISSDRTDPRCALTLTHAGIPKEWVEDMTVIWMAKIDHWLYPSRVRGGPY